MDCKQLGVLKKTNGLFRKPLGRCGNCANGFACAIEIVVKSLLNFTASVRCSIMKARRYFLRPVSTEQGTTAQDRTGRNRTGQDRTGRDRHGQAFHLQTQHKINLITLYFHFHFFQILTRRNNHVEAWQTDATRLD